MTNGDPSPRWRLLLRRLRLTRAPSTPIAGVASARTAPAQTRLLRVTYEQLGLDGIVRRSQAEHALRYLYPFECEHLLRRAGLALVDVYGDYDLGPLTNDSERMILLARKATG